jgi:SAM-dependent methyltransferase
MHHAIFTRFNEICATERVEGDVLEVGATLSADTLLNLPALRGVRSRTGIDLEQAGNGDGFTIVKGNANAMTGFADASFDAVLCNSMLEHDPLFWLTLGEIRRVARPGALIVIGVPGYGEMGEVPLRRFMRALARLPGVPKTSRQALRDIRAAAPTLGLHFFPGDYYRFSEAAVRDVLLAGTEGTQTERLMMPPRFIGWGRRKAHGAAS